MLMGMIFVFSSIPSDRLPGFEGPLDVIVKKGGHMLGYGLLALAYLRGTGASRPRVWFLAWALAVLYALTDEFHQSFTAGRGATLRDVGIDAVGAALALGLRGLFAKF